MAGRKGLTTLAATALLGTALLSGSATGTAAQKPRAFTKYVACGLSQKATPSHRCAKRHRKGAFFRSNVGDVFYTVCVRFPTKKHLCAPRQEAVRGTLYVNKITTNIPGVHVATWFVKGKRVGRWWFHVPRRANAPQRQQPAR